jgi:hypothetical protein
MDAFFRTGLRKMTIPSSVEVIGECCFSTSRFLCEITSETGSKLKEIGRWTFDGINLAKIALPSKCEFLITISLRNVKSVTIFRDHPVFVIAESFVLSSDRKRLVRYLGSDSRVLIKKEIEMIGKECICSCKSLYEITFEPGSKPQRIENSAFYASGLKKMTIPLSVKAIGIYCIAGCECLWQIPFERDAAEL